jgi:hypothetical protein
MAHPSARDELRVAGRGWVPIVGKAAGPNAPEKRDLGPPRMLMPGDEAER